MRPLDGIRGRLNHAQAVFCRTADRISSEKWAIEPAPEQWSAAEVVAHLVAVERAVITKADHVSRKTPLPISTIERLHLPMWFVEARLIKRKSPLPMDPGLMAEKETMLGMLRAARERTFAFLAETEKRDLSAYYWRHPFIGMLCAYEWMEMLAAHQIRHAKQMREIHRKISRK